MHSEKHFIQNLISPHDQQFQQQQTEAYDLNQLVAAASQTVLTALPPDTSEYEYASDVSHASPISMSDDDVARETQIVDDILRSRAQDLPDNWNDDNVSSESFNDEDSNWEPTSPSFDENSSIGSPVASTSSSAGKIKSSSSDRKRTRPYGRGPEERKSRKKEQNKNAATRYVRRKRRK
uniref:BZIP domain-containing protein n=1 Tax=Megaselia scalaris TaxID=36166 RepID=T1GT53_MEGSC